ncbi:MAG: hypothetical protein HY886_04215 [Deltaproteobacteria bacterium]|nr:hypothetical protein [Deltaproteobacteria bacterium]
MTMKKPEINKIPTVIDAKSALDMFGKSYRVDHVKGLAEWLKNSVDAYRRDGFAQGKHTPDSEQVILIRFRDRTKTEPIRFECIDFSGTTRDAIINNFMRWFDMMAAKRGLKELKVYGGHGNGGKFYMRQMFETSRLLTYRDGRLSIFGFDKDKDYGFLEGFDDIKVAPKEALKLAAIDDLTPRLPPVIQERIERGDIRFTVVSGAKPQAVGAKKYNNMLDRLRVHPQSRNIIQTALVYGVSDDGALNRLEPEVIKPKADFEGPFISEIPDRLPCGNEYVFLANDKFAKGKLTLHTSEEPFDRNGDNAALNCISFKSKGIGTIAAYNISDLGGTLRNHEVIEFIYGECECPILEDPAFDLVQNDREHLVKSDISDALLRWICDKVNDVTDKMVERSEREQQQEDLRKSSEFNDFLNKWMNKFMDEVMSDILTGTNPGDVGGLGEGDGIGKGSANKTAEKGGISAKGSGSGDKKTKGFTHTRILLSNVDDDPLHPGKTVIGEPEHPLVFQRDEDEPKNIYWINTRSPVASKIRVLDKLDDGHESPRWKEYLLHRQVEICLKQRIKELIRHNAQVSAKEINNKIDEIYRKVYKTASDELDKYLFQG